MSKPKSLRIFYTILALMLVCCLAMLTLVACGDSEDPSDTPASIEVTFKVDGAVYKTVTVQAGETLTLPDNPTKEGYDFAGWFLDEDLNTVLDVAKLEGSVTVYAKWTEKGSTPGPDTPSSLTVTFVADGETYHTLTIKAGGSLTIPAAPTKEGYDFAGWYLDDGTFERAFDGVVTGSVTVYAKFTQKVAQHEHNYLFDSFVWAEDFTAQAKYVCEGDASHVELYAATVTSETTLEPACGVAGETTYTASYDGHKATKTAPIAALEHDYIFDSFVWAEDFTAKAMCICSHDAAHIAYEDTELTVTVTEKPTCEKTGKRTYTVTYGDNTAFKIETIAALEHDYIFDSFVWAEDFTAQAKYVCKNDSSHVELYTATVTSETTTKPACGVRGEKTYTATYEGQTDTKIETLPALEHDWGDWEITTPATCTEKGEETRVCSHDESHKETRPIEATGHKYEFDSFVWAEDFTAQAKYVCKNDEKHVELHEATVTSKTTREPACGVAGETTYTATYDGHTDTKTAPIAALEHDWGDWEITTPATCTEKGEETRVCSYDASHKETRPIDAAGHDYQPVPEKPATYTATGVAAHYTCSRCDVIFDADKNPTTADALILSKLPFTITFDDNGGAGGPGTAQATNYGDWPAVTAVPTRTGYTFDGYYTSGEAHVYTSTLEILSGACFFEGPDTLTAHWIPVTVTVYFDHNGGESSLASVQATYDEDMRALSKEVLPTKDKYLFVGYFTAKEGGEKYYNQDGTSAKKSDLTENTTLYAQWENGVYFVHYSANAESGVTGTMADQKMHCDVTEKIASCAFTRTGYTFEKWNTEADGSGTDYAPNKEVTDLAANAETVTLYAIWNAKEYTVSLDRQNGTGGPDSFSATTDETPDDLETVPTKTGYLFGGYYGSTSWTEQYFDADGKAVKSWDIDTLSPTLFARWTPKTTTVDVMSNGKKVATLEATYDAILPGYNVGRRAGYTLVGIFDAEEGGTMYYDNNSYYVRKWDKEDATATLYVRWNPNTYTVSFQPKLTNSTYETTGEMEPIEVTYGQPMPHVDITYKRVGYHLQYLRFNGAPTIDFYDGNGDSLQDFNIDGNVTLTAVWEPNHYTISFDGNGATSGMQASVEIGYDSRVQNLTPGYSRTGYTFNGYFDAAVGGTQWVNMYGGVEDSLHYTRTEDTTLYAHWTPKKYSVSWIGNGGSINISSVEATYDAVLPTINAANCTRTGYNFDGFFDAAEGGTRYYNADGTGACKWTLTPGSTTYLYAHWTPKTFTVSFDMRDGSPQQADITVTYAAMMPTENVTVVPTKQYYAFGGYYNGGGSICFYTSELAPWVSWNINGDGTLYAVWNNGTYKVRFLPNGATSGSSSGYEATFTNNGEKSLRSGGFTRDGYTLTGWNTKADGKGTHYDLEEYVINLADNGETFDLYAEWAPREYTVTLSNDKGEFDLSFDLNYEDAPEAPATQHITYATPIVYPIPALRAGYLFGGWYQNPDCTTTFDASRALTADTVLYAKWIAYDGDATIVNLGSENAITVTSSDQKFVIRTLASGTITIRVGKDATIVYGGYDSTGVKNLGVGAGYEETFFIHSKNRSEDAEYIGTTTLTISRVVSEGGRAGSAANQTVKLTYDALPDLTDYVPTSEGYTFGGWYTSTGGNGTKMTDADGAGVANYEIAGASTLYAYWIGNKYTVTFDANGGTGGPESDEFTFDACPPNLDPEALPTREDYDFIGYWTEKSSGDRYIEGNGSGVNTWLYAEDRTLYAHWSLAHYSIVYDANGGDSGTMTVDEPQRTKDFTLPTSQYSRTGYTFTGWNTQADGSGTSYAAKEVVSDLADAHGSITLYAQWTAKTYTVTPIKNLTVSHTVTFDLNGASGEAPEAQVVDLVTDLVLPIPTRDGYLFGGWYEDPSCTDLYDMTDTHAEDVTLYAKWVARTVELDEETLSDLFVIGDQRVVTLNGGTLIYLPIVSPVDQTVKMWSKRKSTKVDPYAILYAADKETSITSNDDGGGDRNFWISQTLTANTLYYLAVKDYGTGVDDILVYVEAAQKKSGARHLGEALSDETVTFDAAYDLPVPSLTGYVFDGWYTLPAGEGTQLTDGAGHSLAAWRIEEDAKVYAKWTIGTYTVTFDANGGEGGQESLEEVTYGDPTPTITTAPTRTDYIFAGYFTEAEGGVKYYNADLSVAVAVWDIGANVTLYAHWTPTFYTVTFNANTGEGSMDDQKIYKDTETDLSANTFTKVKNVFAGWNTQADGKGTSYTDKCAVNNAVSVGETLTLYAIWAPQSYTVRFNANTGSGSMSDLTLYYNVEGNLSANAYTKTGYHFVKWNTEADGSGDDYDNEEAVTDLVDVGETFVLYAQWELITTDVTLNTDNVKLPVTVHFDLNGGVGIAPADQVITWNIGLEYPVDPSRTGYGFAGWFDNAEGSGSPFDFSADIDDDLTLYAHWVALEYATSQSWNVVGNISLDTFADLTIEKGGNYYYVVYSPVAQIVTFYTTGHNDSDPQGRLCSASGKELAANGDVGGYNPIDDVNSNYNFSFDCALEANTIYYLHVYGYSAATEGDTVVHVTGSRPDGGLSIKNHAGTASITYGETKDIAAIEDVTGYTFAGWYDGEGGTGTLYVNASGKGVCAWDKEEDCILYAKWIPVKVTIDFDANSGSGAPASVEAAYGSDMPTIVTMPTKEGQVITGFFDAAYGGTKYYNADLTSACKWDKLVDTTLYAQWENEFYFMEYYSNGSDEETYTQRIYRDMPQELESTRFSRTGYTFMGWNTESDGSGFGYPNGMSVYNEAAHGETITLYAQWNANMTTVTLKDGFIHPVTVTFNANGGTGAPEAQVVTSVVGLEYPTTVPTRAGYLFRGWFKDAGGVNAFSFGQRDGAKSDLENDVTLYAGWHEIPGSVEGVLVCDSETEISIDGETYTKYYIISMIAQKVTFYTEGYLDTIISLYNDNWSKKIAEDDNSQDGLNARLTYALKAGVVYTVGVRGAGVSDIGDITLCITGRKGNDALPTAGALSQNKVFDTTILTYDNADYSLSVPENKTGYLFNGWKLNSGIVYTDAEGNSIRAWDVDFNECDLIPHWVPVRVTITFDKQGGTEGSNSIELDYEHNAYVGTPVKEGYIFLGYFSAAEGGKSYVYNGSTNRIYNFDLVTDTTLYAHWELARSVVTLSEATLNSVTVSFDANGGIGAPSAQVLEDGDALVYPATLPTRDGYLFAGWYDNADCSGTVFDFTAAVRYDVTLYAKWVAHIECYKLLSGGEVAHVELYGRNWLYFPILVLANQVVTLTSSGDIGDKDDESGSYYFDPYCYLLDDKLDCITTNDQDGGGNHFLLSYSLSAGRLYYFVATNYYDNAVCEVDLTLSTLTLPTAGGTFDNSKDAQKRLTYGDDSFSFEVPVKAGYTFDGWFDGEGGTGTRYTDENGDAVKAWDKAANTTLYAKWIED